MKPCKRERSTSNPGVMDTSYGPISHTENRLNLVFEYMDKDLKKFIVMVTRVLYKPLGVCPKKRRLIRRKFHTEARARPGVFPPGKKAHTWAPLRKQDSYERPSEASPGSLGISTRKESSYEGTAEERRFIRKPVRDRGFPPGQKAHTWAPLRKDDSYEGLARLTRTLP
jgi:hypothetical protein